jgi:septal ring factor EnvC (AmiA/AmiB activator)
MDKKSVQRTDSLADWKKNKTMEEVQSVSAALAYFQELLDPSGVDGMVQRVETLEEQLKTTRTDLEHVKAQLQATRIELEQTKVQLKLKEDGLQQSRAQAESKQAQLQQSALTTAVSAQLSAGWESFAKTMVNIAGQREVLVLTVNRRKEYQLDVCSVEDVRDWIDKQTINRYRAYRRLHE